MNNFIVAAVIGAIFNLTIITIVTMMATRVDGSLQVAGFVVAGLMLALASVRTYKRYSEIVNTQ